LEQVFVVSHSYQTYFGFPGSDFNLDCGLRDHVITRFVSVVELQHCVELEDMVHMATKVERQIKRKGSTLC